MTDNKNETFIMPDHLAKAKKRMQGYSHIQLLEVVHAEFPGHFERKAALLLLAEMDAINSDKKHKRILVVSILTLIVALLTLVVAMTGFSWKDFLELLKTDYKKQDSTLTTKTEKPTPIKGLPPAISNQPSNKVLSQDKKQIK
jgi:hypothetical protein